MVKLREERAAISALRAVKVAHRSMMASLFTTAALLLVFFSFVMDFAINMRTIGVNAQASEVLTEIVL